MILSLPLPVKHILHTIQDSVGGNKQSRWGRGGGERAVITDVDKAGVLEEARKSMFESSFVTYQL